MPTSQDQMTFVFSNDEGAEIECLGPLWVRRYDGLGLSRLRRITKSGPQQHGETLTAALWQGRVITMNLRFQATSEPELEALRDELYDIMNPSTTFYLDSRRASGDVRRLDVLFSDGLSGMRRANGLYYIQEDTVQLTCSSVFPYTAEWAEERYGPPAGADLAETHEVYYPGTWAAVPILCFYGPMTGPACQNLTTGDELAFLPGASVPAGEYWEVDLRYGNKTARDGDGVSVLEYLANPTDLATFAVDVSPEAPGGLNRLRASGSGCNGNSYTTIRYQVRWRGV